MTATQTIFLKVATDADEAVLETLAALDSKPALRGPAVVALVDGRPVAAASLRDDAIVADPFLPSADVVELLQARVAASAATAGRRRPRFPRLGLPRLRPAA